MIKLLVVDDSALMRKLLGGIFGNEPDFEIAFARNGVEALDRLRSFQPDVVTLDVQMPEMDGLECLQRIMIENPCPVVMVSSLTAQDADATLEAMRIGAVDFIAKPGGALSLGVPDMAQRLVSKVRAATEARPRSSLLLRQRVRHRLRSAAKEERVATRPAGRSPGPKATAATGKGLVLIGSSTGGPPALEAVLAPLPATFSWPIVIAQHMPQSFTGALAARLDRLCEISVLEVTKPVRLEPGHAYLARGDADVIVSVRGGHLVAMPAPSETGYPWHPSTERLVRSAMLHVTGSQLIGTLLTGMGNDGAPAMTELHEAGGRTIAEAQETAVVWGMPGELVKLGGAEWVLPVTEISALLQQIVP